MRHTIGLVVWGMLGGIAGLVISNVVINGLKRPAAEPVETPIVQKPLVEEILPIKQWRSEEGGIVFKVFDLDGRKILLCRREDAYGAQMIELRQGEQPCSK